MQQYHVVNQTLRLATGTLGLTPAQARVRAHVVKRIKGGAYEIVAPVQFKVGEVVGIEGDVPKVLREHLKTSEEIKAAAAQTSVDGPDEAA